MLPFTDAELDQLLARTRYYGVNGLTGGAPVMLVEHLTKADFLRLVESARAQSKVLSDEIQRQLGRPFRLVNNT